MSRAVAIGAALIAVACGREVRTVGPAIRASRADPSAALDPVELRSGLEAAVVELYGHIALGNLGAAADTLATDHPIALVGVGPEVVVGRSRRAAERDRRLLGDHSPILLPRNLEVALLPDGSAGWVFDELSYRVLVDDRLASLPIRHTSAWGRDFDRWMLAVEHWSYAVPIAELRAMAAGGRLPPPVALTAAVARPTELLGPVGTLHNGSAAARAALYADGEALLVLTPEAELRGEAARAAPSLAEQFGPGALVAVREYQAGRSASGEIAWLVASLVVATVVDDRPVELGLRGSYLARRTDAGWRFVQVHVSAPVVDQELSRRAFGIE